MKLMGWIKLNRSNIRTEIFLNDAEFRVFLLLRRLAGWDKRDLETYEKVNRSVKELSLLLPKCSQSKFSLALRGLQEKGFIARNTYRQICLINKENGQNTERIDHHIDNSWYTIKRDELLKSKEFP